MIQQTVLLVEDDFHDTEIIRLAFGRIKSPHNHVIVSNGRQAIRYLSGLGEYQDRQKFPFPALVLLDLTLPEVSGFEVLAWIQGEPPGKMPPVVVISYSTLESDKNLAKKSGARDYYVKSVDFEETVKMMERVLALNWLPPGPSGEEPEKRS